MPQLLSDCGGTRELYEEIDSTVQFVAKAWTQRSGGARTRERALQPSSLRVTVGVDYELLRGPPPVGRSATPDLVPATVDLGSAMGPLKVYGEGEACSTVSRVRNVERTSAHEPMTDEFHVEDFILLESPTLADLHWANKASKDLGPIRRTVQFFPALLVLLKLRWLIRLHSAFVEVAGEKGSLQRLFNGMLLDVTGVNDLPHSPLPIYEAMVACLETRLGQSWPLFLAFMSMREPSYSSKTCLRSRGGPLSSIMPDGVGDMDALWAIADDIFVAWFAQQDGVHLPATQMWQEFQYFQVPPPVIRIEIPSLASWMSVKDVSGSRERFKQEARVEAHHLAILLEVPSFRTNWPLDDQDTIELALAVVAYPKVFTLGVRHRVQWVLKAAALLGGTLSEDAAGRVRRGVISEVGVMTSSTLDKLRDQAAPRAVGSTNRYKDPHRQGAIVGEN